VNARRLLIALIAGALVAGLVYQASLARVRAEESVDVLVASRDLPPRTILTADAVRTVSMPRHLVPPGAMQTLEAAQQRILRDQLFAGEVVNDRRLVAPGSTELSASALVPDGKTYAFNLPVSLFLSAPPRLQVHDRIDIVAYPAGKPVSEGGVIVQDLEIIDISPRTSENASGSAFLTIGATADDIVRILAAREGFTLAIAVRPFVRR
jgi:Flp pilus assembly protein CpaB